MTRFEEEISHRISQSILRAVTIVLIVVEVITIYFETTRVISQFI